MFFKRLLVWLPFLWNTPPNTLMLKSWFPNWQYWKVYNFKLVFFGNWGLVPIGTTEAYPFLLCVCEGFTPPSLPVITFSFYHRPKSDKASCAGTDPSSTMSPKKPYCLAILWHSNKKALTDIVSELLCLTWQSMRNKMKNWTPLQVHAYRVLLTMWLRTWPRLW